MSLPSVTISKNINSTSQAPPSTTGILAILAASSTGTVNVPGGFARTDLAITADGYGPLTEYGAYDISQANNPVVLCKGNATFPGTLGALTKALGTGSSTITDNASAPYDTYNFQLTFLTGGTQGVAGITYQTSQDGGNTNSGPQALGTAATITVPNTGISLSIGAGSVAAGATVQAYTTRPMLNDTDITNGLAGLNNSRLPFEGVLIDCSAGAGTVGVIDTILATWETQGKFKFAVINSRYKTEPEPTGETEAAYATALTTTFGSQSSARVVVGADGGHEASPITGWNLKRPTSMFTAARAMAIQIGEDPAFVGRGPLSNCQIADANSNPFDHDEDLFPNLDSLRLTSLRSFAGGVGPEGVYITNANVLSPSGSNIVYLQHLRVLNRACEIAWGVLTRQLSRGVRKNNKKDPVTGAITILEADASAIDSLVNDAARPQLKGQVNAFQFTLSRTDDMSALPVIVHGLLEITALAYIKGFVVQAQFSKTIQSAL